MLCCLRERVCVLSRRNRVQVLLKHTDWLTVCTRTTLNHHQVIRPSKSRSPLAACVVYIIALDKTTPDAVHILDHSQPSPGCCDCRCAFTLWCCLGDAVSFYGLLRETPFMCAVRCKRQGCIILPIHKSTNFRSLFNKYILLSMFNKCSYFRAYWSRGCLKAFCLKFVFSSDLFRLFARCSMCANQPRVAHRKESSLQQVSWLSSDLVSLALSCLKTSSAR